MYFEDTILDYIQLVRDSVPNSVDVFTQGNCGPFARMLLKTFPGGTIRHNIDHAVYEYRGQWYDITGKVTKKYKGMIPIEEYGLDKAIMMLKPNYK